jgi:histone acetyltransferase (RNA polymerase elongator complex component)
MANLEAKRHQMALQNQISTAEELLKGRFSEAEFEQIKAAALARGHRSISPNSEVYASSLQWAVFMSNDKKSAQEIIELLNHSNFDEQAASLRVQAALIRDLNYMDSRMELAMKDAEYCQRLEAALREIDKFAEYGQSAPNLDNMLAQLGLIRDAIKEALK